MTDNVHYLIPPPRQIAHYLRISPTGHRQLEHLLSAGRLPPTRFVVDAASHDHQTDLIKALRAPRPPERGGARSRSDPAHRRV